ncbi:MAG: DUF3090 family protein [Actinomycetota bacterium]|nr:DUF3090 family protein [Actinomycetota bacterium]
MSASFEMDGPIRVALGTIGIPGQRTFYLQIEQDARTVSMKLEKQQVGAFGQLLAEMLADLPTPEDVPAGSDVELVEPLDADWVVGGIQLSYDTDADRIVLLFEEAVAEPGEDSAIGRLSISRGQAVALIGRTVALLEGGRPPCALCGNPMDPSGHACPRTNGHRPRTP